VLRPRPGREETVERFIHSAGQPDGSTWEGPDLAETHDAGRAFPKRITRPASRYHEKVKREAQGVGL
jgi:hypothetical protein